MRIKISLDKCRVLVLTIGNSVPNLSFRRKTIPVIHVVLDLALFVEDKLAFHEYCSQTVEKASRIYEQVSQE